MIGVAHDVRPLRPAGADDDRPNERGAVLIVVVLFLAVTLICTALAVDIGRVSATRRDLQKVADVISLDLEHQLDGRTAAEISHSESWSAAIAASRDRNHFDDAAGRDLTAELGQWDATTRTFTPSAPGDVPDAVRVTATDTVDYQFVPGSNRTSRHAVATHGPPAAGFSVDGLPSTEDEFDGLLPDRVVEAALGGPLTSVTNVAGGTVSLDALAAALGLDLGDPATLNADVDPADVIKAEATVLRADGDATRAAILDGLWRSLPPNRPTIQLGQLIDIEPGGSMSAKEASVDALQLLVDTGLNSAAGNALDLGGISVDVPGIRNAALRIQVTPRPAWVFGPEGSEAHSPAARLTFTGEMDPKVLEDSPSAITASVTVDVPSATGTSTDIECAAPQQLAVDAASGTTTAASRVTGSVAYDKADPGEVVATLDATLHETGTGAAGTARFTLPPDRFGGPQVLGSGTFALTGTQLGPADVTTVPDDRANPLDPRYVLAELPPDVQSEAVDPMLLAVSHYVSGPATDVLGIAPAGPTVTPLAITCGDPSLVE